jgi:uncharacterized protein
MKLEYHPAKSAANQAKHGISFDEAQALWLDPDLIEAPARAMDEARFLVVGRIGGKHWAAICTHRGEHVRIISVRRARIEEIRHYESD